MAPSRREMLKATGLAFSGLFASAKLSPVFGLEPQNIASPYGPLRGDPAGLLDLPESFSYRVISRFGDAMDDGETVPDAGDGMGCLALPDGKIALIRNHELEAGYRASTDLTAGFDRTQRGRVLAGGTTTIVLDPRSLEVEGEFRSLAGTIRNCAGGVTPWGSWLSCEEEVVSAGGKLGCDHGWVFEIPADAKGLVDPQPLKAMGRFHHEAAAVDPATGIVYMTEDRKDGLLYRFLPVARGNLAQKGRLQALTVPGVADARNWYKTGIEPGTSVAASWIDLDEVESPGDDLRLRGAARGAMPFARGEGIHMGDGEAYFCCSSGGRARLGQVFRLTPSTDGQDRLTLFFESTSDDHFKSGDNLTVAPNGHLIVCEDRKLSMAGNHLRGITPAGEAYPFARLHASSKLAGACFSPDGAVMFINVFSPTQTLAITGPWQDLM